MGEGVDLGLSTILQPGTRQLATPSHREYSSERRVIGRVAEHLEKDAASHRNERLQLQGMEGLVDLGAQISVHDQNVIPVISK